MELIVPLWVFGLWSLLVGGFGVILGYFISSRSYADGYDRAIEDASTYPEPEPAGWVPQVPKLREPSEAPASPAATSRKDKD